MSNCEKHKFDSSKVCRVSLYQQISSEPTPFDHRPALIDQSSIINSNSYRQLSAKTQVFFRPTNSYVSNRLTHTGDLFSIATKTSLALDLDTDLVGAIAHGHDTGHGPVGHVFEQEATKRLKRIYPEREDTEFNHEVMSGILATFIENKGKGLNLTYDTVLGIIKHPTTGRNKSLDDFINEYRVISIDDKFSYLFSDIEDFCRHKKLLENDKKMMESIFPIHDRHQCIQICTTALIEESEQKGRVSFDESTVAKDFILLKDYMYQNYYLHDEILGRQKLRDLVNRSFELIEQTDGLKNYDPILIINQMSDHELLDFHLNKVSLIPHKKVPLEKLRPYAVYENIQDGFLENHNYLQLKKDLEVKLNLNLTSNISFKNNE